MFLSKSTKVNKCNQTSVYKLIFPNHAFLYNERKCANSFNYHVNVRLIIAVDSTYEGLTKKHTKKKIYGFCILLYLDVFSALFYCTFLQAMNGIRLLVLPFVIICC